MGLVWVGNPSRLCKVSWRGLAGCKTPLGRPGWLVGWDRKNCMRMACLSGWLAVLRQAWLAGCKLSLPFCFPLSVSVSLSEQCRIGDPSSFCKPRIAALPERSRIADPSSFCKPRIAALPERSRIADPSSICKPRIAATQMHAKGHSKA